MSKDKENKDTKDKDKGLSAGSAWLTDFSMLMSNGFTRSGKMGKRIWHYGDKTFKTNKEAIKYMEVLMEGN